jgi:hypothetical protein
VSLDEHLIKVRSCLNTRLDEVDRERIIDLGTHFEELDNKDLREIMAIASKPNS